MKKFVIRISAAARNDLKNIGRYTAREWGVKQRNDYLARFDEIFQKLAINPKIGRPCDEIRKDYRRLREGEHVIFYRIVGKNLDVVRLLHKNMDVKNHFII